MRRFSMVAAALAVILGAGAATAGPSLFAGVSLPVGDFADGAKLGFHGGGGYLFEVTPLAAVGARLTYNRFATESDLPLLEGNFNLVEALAVGKLSLPAGPHFLAGLGVTSMKFTSDAGDSDWESKFTAVAGVGYSLTMLEMTVLYHNVATDGSSTGYVSASAGITF